MAYLSQSRRVEPQQKIITLDGRWREGKEGKLSGHLSFLRLF